MKRGIKMTWEYAGNHPNADTLCVRITKSRGKLTLHEIEDLLLYEDNQAWCGHYAILENCSESAADGAGWYMEDDPKGDTVVLYKLDEGESCPVCGGLTPPYDYCPSCGTAWKDCDLDIEKTLRLMREETLRMLRESESRDSRLAWYWTYIGALDLARQLNFLTGERRQELARESEAWKPA
ncbi:MAG: hypothetical protein HFF18_13195 [Oscillospiraceae bacterium]|nr:hypothetical protein [Oscillospiraceae bacterium]